MEEIKEKRRNTRSPRLTEHGVTEWSAEMWPKTLAYMRLPFIIYFFYESVSNTYLIKRSSRLRDIVTLGRFPL
jgi:hypothetical protein